MLLRLLLMIAVSFVFLWGCLPKADNAPQTTVTVTPDVGNAPPVPPKAETVMEPPKVSITKPARDPFSPLAGEGAITAMPTIPDGQGPEGGSPKVKPPVVEGPQYRVVGIIANKNATAIIEMGGNSWAVRKGDKVSDWTVVAVESKQVVLRKGKEILKLNTPTGGG